METELQQAERFAREFLDSPYALYKTRLLARVFLAQQARLAEVERERDEWRTAWDGVNTHRNQLREALAAAERKATEAVEARRVGLFTDGATWLAGRLGLHASAIVMTQYEAAEEARRRYPAHTEREATPPQAAPEPLDIPVWKFIGKGLWEEQEYERIQLTPEDCRRIVEMAGFPVPEEGGR